MPGFELRQGQPKADEPQIERITRPKKRPRSGHATQIAAAKAPEKAEDPKGEQYFHQIATKAALAYA
jgi:hypothetical protein